MAQVGTVVSAARAVSDRSRGRRTNASSVSDRADETRRLLLPGVLRRKWGRAGGRPVEDVSGRPRVSLAAGNITGVSYLGGKIMGFLLGAVSRAAGAEAVGDGELTRAGEVRSRTAPACDPGIARGMYGGRNAGFNRAMGATDPRVRAGVRPPGRDGRSVVATVGTGGKRSGPSVDDRRNGEADASQREAIPTAVPAGPGTQPAATVDLVANAPRGGTHCGGRLENRRGRACSGVSESVHVLDGVQTDNGMEAVRVSGENRGTAVVEGPSYGGCYVSPPIGSAR